MDNNSQSNKNRVSKAFRIVSLFHRSEDRNGKSLRYKHNYRYSYWIISCNITVICNTNLWVDKWHCKCSSIGTAGSLPAFRLFLCTKQNIPIFTQYVVFIVVFPTPEHFERSKMIWSIILV